MKSLKPKRNFSRPQLLVFTIAFALIGYLIFRSLAAPNPSLPGDLNGDNTVNISDLSIMLSDFGTSNAAADINGDGTINVLDLSILLSHYGESVAVTNGSLWGSSSPFNTLISANPAIRINYNSGPLSGLAGIGLSNTFFGVGIFEYQSGWSHQTLVQDHCPSTCWKIDNVPIPPQMDAYLNAMISLSDSERHMSILEGDKVYSLYGMNKDTGDGQWHFRQAGVLRYGGSGVWNNNKGLWVGRASGFADGAGPYRKAELDAGVINHALVVSWPKDRIATSPISPAVTSDGSCISNCAQMGSRIQLDPTLKSTDFQNMGIPSYYFPILVAMQKYGAYIADSSSWMVVFGELWNNGGKITYPNYDCSSGCWYPASMKLVSHLRIVEAPPAPILDDITTFGQPHQ